MIGLAKWSCFIQPNDMHCSSNSCSLFLWSCTNKNYNDHMRMLFDVNACDLLHCLSACWQWGKHIACTFFVAIAIQPQPLLQFLSIVDISSIYRTLSILIAGIRVLFSFAFLSFIHLFANLLANDDTKYTTFHGITPKCIDIQWHFCTACTCTFAHIPIKCC